MSVEYRPTFAKKLAMLTERQRYLHPTVRASNEANLKLVKEMHSKIRDNGIDLDDWTDAMLYAVMESFYRIGDPSIKFNDPEFTALRHAAFCYLKSVDSGDPLWVLNEDSTRALMDTRFPFDTITVEHMEGALRMPFDGFYLQLPRGVFDVMDPETGAHPVEGIYLAYSWAPTQAGIASIENARLTEGDDAWMREFRRHVNEGQFVPTITITVCGAAKGVYKGDVNDTIATAYISDGMKLSSCPEETRRGISVALNFLLAWNSSYLSTEEVGATDAPKNASKQRKAAKRGVIWEEHTLVTLGKKAHKARRAQGRPIPSSSCQGAIVPGHWQTYWVLDSKDLPVLVSKKRDDGETINKIARWRFPYVWGNPQRHPSYYVKGVK